MRSKTDTIHICAAFILSLILPFAAVQSQGIDEDWHCPGRLVLLTESGYQPTIVDLLPDKGFARAKQYESWQITPLSAMFPTRTVADKNGSGSLLDNLYLLHFPDSLDIIEVMKTLNSVPGLRRIEPDYKIELFDWPTDPLMTHQWYLHNTGQQFYAIERIPGNGNDVLYLKRGKVGEDIGLSDIYLNTPADKTEVLVAVIDTGIDYEHPDLADNIFINQNEIYDNGIDDDHNGLIDDYQGWDFAGDTITVLELVGDNDATDDLGHGCHVSGLVAAINNDIGIAGYSGSIKILPLKIFPNGFQSVASAAIIYAADMGADVINMSWGFPFESGILQEVLQYALSRGVLPVAAAGNFGDSRRMYPAAFDETFTVGATNSDGYMTYFSSYGPVLDISAPGRNILSLRAAGTDMYAPGEAGVRIIDDQYMLADGTSMAAPIVAGAAALLKSFNPGLSPEQIADALKQSADDLVDPWGEGDYLPGYDTLSGWGRLNIGRALNAVLEPSAYLTNPSDNAIVFNQVAIGVATTGQYGGPLDLYLGAGFDNKEWNLLHHIDAASDDDSFYIWSADLPSGYYSFKLVSDAGEDQINFRLVRTDTVIILSPLYGEEVKSLVTIVGSSYGEIYDSMTLSYRMENNATYSRIYGSSSYYFEEAIYDWALFSIPEGSVYLRLDAYFDSIILSDSVLVNVVPSMRAGFPVSLGSYAAFSPGVEDITGDGIKEIIVGTREGLFAFDADGRSLPGWPVLTEYDMRSIPAFDDIDGDGLKDVVVIGKNVVGCFNYLGQSLSGWPRDASTGMTFYTYPIPNLAQLTPGGDSAIVYISKYGEVRAYKYDGDPYFYSLDGLFTALDPNIFDTSQFAGMTVPFITTTDLNLDGGAEVVSIYSTTDVPSGIYIWNGRNGLPPFGWDSPLARQIHISHGGMLADIDGDGLLEIIMGGIDTNGVAGIWATKNGVEDVPGWPVYLDGMADWIGTSPICVDIDNNGSKEVLVSYYSYDVARIYAFNSDGTPYFDHQSLPYGVLIRTSTSLSNIIVADIDGDGNLNIISRGGFLFPGTGYERLFAWEPNGDLTPGFPIITPTPPGEVVSLPFTPIIDDLENDGVLEIIMTGDGGDLFVWSTDAPYYPELMPWPRFLHDNFNSGINPKMGMMTDVDDDIGPLPNHFGITDNYPNPFNPETVINFTLDRSTIINLEIFNILGQKVTTLAHKYFPAGRHQLTWNGRDQFDHDVASGVYLARMKSDQSSSTHKMVLLR